MKQVEVLIPDDEVAIVARAILSLCQAATYSPNYIDYSDDVIQAMKLVENLLNSEKNTDHK